MRLMTPVLLVSTIASVAVAVVTPAGAQTQPTVGEYPVAPVPFNQVRIDGGFWGPRFATNREVTIPYTFTKSEETGRIDNFAKAGGLMEGPFKGIRYDDSDVFKIIEGAAYSLATHPDPQLDAYLDELIAKIAAAQEDDGYLFTCRTIDPNNLPRNSGEERWVNVRQSHELYNVGHLYEAAVAHYLVTGKRSLLDVALKNADLVVDTFGTGEGQIRDVPGHQEIEIGLVKLYRVTGDRRYLDQAKFFLDERGHPHGRELGGEYRQDHKPVIEQDKAVGHAVRAVYMYAAMTDIAALFGEKAYAEAVDRLWHDIADSKTYLTGGIGSTRSGEAFGDDFELPNATAYCETCAAIANGLWNHRLFLLSGEGRYLDLLERVLYNGFLSGVSLEGDRFFYPNPLAHDGETSFNHGRAGRSPWFGTSCCPVNVTRFVPSIAGYVYATQPGEGSGDELFVNLFVQGSADIDLDGQRVRLQQQTRYPWDGKVAITVTPEAAREFALKVRIPGWARGEPFPSGLYRDHDQRQEQPVKLTINGEAVEPEMKDGFAVLRRTWQPGDEVLLSLPMPVRRVLADERVEADRGRAALERGPVVYAFEGVDNAGDVAGLALPDDASITAEHRPDLLGGVVVLRADGLRKRRTEDGEIVTEPQTLTAVPYYAWANREVDGAAPPMAVWLPRDASQVELPPPATVATQAEVTASHANRKEGPQAVNDGKEPESSGDHSIPRFTWWSHRGTSEWLQYCWDEPVTVSAAEVYWFDDTGRGFCRVPESWQLLYRDPGSGDWKPVPGAGEYSTRKDQFNRVSFDAVTTDALRIDVQLQPDYSGGVLEWRLDSQE